MITHPLSDPAAAIDLLTRIRDHFLAALELHAKDLPQSAAAEELAATRLVKRTILELHAIKTLKPKKLKP